MIDKTTLREMKTFFESRLYMDRKQNKDWCGSAVATEDARQLERFLELIKKIENLTE